MNYRATRPLTFTRSLLPAACSLLLLAACSDGGKEASAAPGNGPGGRPTPSISLAVSDVATVGRDTIEDATPVTGNLQPIETVDIRARLEGDIDGVFAREGQQVRKGQLLARFENSQQESATRSAEASRESAKTDLATAQWNLDQSRELFKAGAIAQQDLKVQEQAVAAAKAKVAAAEAQVRSMSSSLVDTRVLAPTDGVIAQRTVEDGEHVARGAQLFSLVRGNVLELQAAVPERRANQVRAGQTVHFVANGERFDGHVARVSPVIDPATRSVTVYVQVPNEAGQVKGGTFASGRVVNRRVPDALVIPTTALRQTPDKGQPFVYRIESGVIGQAPVELGIVDESGGEAQVISGLAEGDKVIVGNVGTLGRGMKVTILGGGDQGAGSRDQGGSNGSPNGTANGSPNGSPNGTPNGTPNRNPNGGPPPKTKIR